MPRVDVSVSCPVFESFRVQQVAGMFDVPLEAQSHESFSVELPELEEPWEVGLIVGPSGSGKSTVARAAYREQLYQRADWPTDRAVIDCFEHLPIERVVELFTAVGFSSPPSWVKPYAVLSNGEQFRCDLVSALGAGCGALGASSQIPARTCSEPVKPAPSAHQPAPIIFDEFTSVVDRNVAKACSTAIAKGVRRGSLPRFVAVTCHYDVAEWLEADWVLDMATGTLTRRRLRRPRLELAIHRCGLAAWEPFARHHYLSGSLNRVARCYLATWSGVPVAFAATLPVIGRRAHRRFTRLVTLPDFQGMGIGTRVLAEVASLHRELGHRVNITSSHPSLIRHCRSSSLWKAVSVNKLGRRHGSRISAGYRSSAGRAVVSFEYQGS
ncbi:GNAT family N-acetyltransferase [Adhaeretor mobilis]|uniref:N-acetyltransferase domain-containing protein n=1 Tax=Adhaeretor mobilis TaxID=1930276 RepID=A0A517N297_9BACT|nr:GNAT family N-acetyltransferase [Adhaeretor mobilis]QDT01280.1 hypothetical protein HG15A2_46220 [Adhaeretor mobilis]